MWDDDTRTLYFQVGIGEGNAAIAGDHDIWRLPQADDTYASRNPLYRYIRHRPVFRAGPPGSPVSPNLAGRLAAAFGLCFQVFHASDPSLADRCLAAGEHVFDLADTHPRRLLTVIPYDFYPETEWRDDLELGATELADALAAAPGTLPGGLPHTGEAFYLQQAARWARSYMSQGDADSDPLNLYDVSGLADYDLYRAISRAGNAGGLTVGPGALAGDIRNQLDAAELQARSDPFGFGFAWNASDTTSHGAGLSVLASEYAALTGDARYRTLSVRWLDAILGANPWGASLIIGDGSDFPRCPQHQVANIVGSRSGRGAVLAGAVVEGPTSGATSGALDGMRACPGRGGDRFTAFNGRAAVFEDNVQSYSTVEPAIDLTASSPLAFAWQIARAGR
jgi:endoglucanase